MQEVIPSCPVGHSDVPLTSRTSCYPIHIGYQSKVSLETAWREKFREERDQQSLIEVIVNLSTINTLWQQSYHSVPWDFLWRQVGAALKTKKCVTESEHEFLKCLTLDGQGSTWSQGLYICWYVKPINPEKTNRNNCGGSVGKSYCQVCED